MVFFLFDRRCLRELNVFQNTDPIPVNTVSSCECFLGKCSIPNPGINLLTNVQASLSMIQSRFKTPGKRVRSGNLPVPSCLIDGLTNLQPVVSGCMGTMKHFICLLHRTTFQIH